MEAPEIHQKAEQALEDGTGTVDVLREWRRECRGCGHARVNHHFDPAAPADEQPPDVCTYEQVLGEICDCQHFLGPQGLPLWERLLQGPVP